MNTSITMASILELNEALAAYTETLIFKDERYGYGACYEETFQGYQFDNAGNIYWVVEIDEGCGGSRWVDDTWHSMHLDDLVEWWKEYQQKEIEKLLDSSS